MRIRTYFSFFLILFIVQYVITARIYAEEWSFGIIPDTQWSQDDPFEGVAVHVIDAINAEMVRQKVDFVVAVGDLVDASSLESLRMREKHNATLREAGIPFYPLRGNHDSSTLRSVEYFAEVFPDLPGTPGRIGSSPNLPNAAGKTYSFTHKGVKLILLDSFPLVDDGSKRGKAYSIKDYLPWMKEELEKDDHRAVFLFSHLALVGQKHKSNLFGKVRLTQNNHSEMQDAFYSLMQSNGVKFLFCGHDHLYHRSRIASPDGKSQIQQVICGSASHKFYRPKYPFTSREAPLAQELNRVGFLIGRVNDDRIQFEYYSTDPFGEQAYTPKWELRETFGYDFEGNEFEQTSPEMKRIYRPTILSLAAMPETIVIGLGILVLIFVIRILRTKKHRLSPELISAETENVRVIRINNFIETTRKGNESMLLKWRNLLPILFVLLCIPAVIGFRLPFESHTWDHVLEVSCLFVGLLGLAIRALTYGYESPSPSNSAGHCCLNTGGMYSYMRYPLVLGNFFLFLAPVMFLHTWWLGILYGFVFLVYAMSSIQEKERCMQSCYGSEYAKWATETPLIVPKSFRWMIPGNGFSWKKAVLHEYRYFFGFVIVMTALEHVGNFVVNDAFALSPVWTSFLAFGAGTYLFVYSLIGTSLLFIFGH